MVEVINNVLDLRVYLDFDEFIISLVVELWCVLSVSNGIFMLIVWKSNGNCYFGYVVSFIS